MADVTYMPLVYMQQGGDVQVVASGGEVTIESGGLITAESGGGFKIESGGSLDLESGGGVDIQSGADITVEAGGDVTVDLGGAAAFPVNGATSSGWNGSSTLSTQSDAGGVTFLNSSAVASKITLAAPYPGARKTIYNTAGSAGLNQYVSVGDGIGIVTTSGGSTAHMMVNVSDATTADGLAGWCHLTGLRATRWIRTSYSPTSQWVIVSTSS